MNKEKILIVLGAALIGIVIASSLFYLYQRTRQVSDKEIEKIQLKDTTDDTSQIPLTIDEPVDESVVSEKTINIVGKTSPNAKIVILTRSNEEAGVAAGNGSFSMDVSLSNGENIIEIIAVTPKGEMVKTTRVVTYSTEDF